MNAQQVINSAEPSRTDPRIDPSAAELDADSSVRAATGAFEVHMQREGFSENTVKAFLSDLRILTQYVGAGTAVRNISTNDLNHFVDWLANERGVPCNPKSLARRITTLKVFFGWLVESSVLLKDAAEPVVHKPVMTPLPTILSDTEFDAVLQVAQTLRRAEKPDARPYLLLTLLLHTGIKKSECMNIVLNHIDTSNPEQPFLWIRYSNPRRRHKERKLRLPVWWPDTLAEYREQHQIHDTLFPCTARNLEYVLRHVADLTDLSKGLAFELLRWTCVVRDYRDGMPDDRLRQKLGISKITWREVRLKILRLTSPVL
ncbi:MAG: site-specific integrase [Anaerolineae bacterium]|nr:site-specific integrase [Anaerolineae bacterium]